MANSALDYLYSLEKFGIRLGLETVTSLLELLGNPQRAFKVVHVGGTNGKGSTCAFLASVLHKAGYSVGLYTSPHLVAFNERVKINNLDISDGEIADLTDFIRFKVEAAGLQVTFFEFTTALAFLYFARHSIEVAVVEVGMGGRLDATNVVQPEVTVITNIGMDHMDYLGRTLPAIAEEKLGIVKKECTLVTAEENPAILELFRQRCAAVGAPLLVVQEQIQAVQLSSSFEKQEFRVSGVVDGAFSIGLLGNHQVTNACTALAALYVLREKGFPIPSAALAEGLASARWPARLEVVSREPLVIVDGAHNVPGMRTLADFVSSLHPSLYQRRILVLAIAQDKDIPVMVKLLVPLFSEVIVTKGNFKPAETSVIAAEARKYCESVHEIPVVADAIAFGVRRLQKKDFMLVTGSLYMVGEGLRVLRRLCT